MKRNLFFTSVMIWLSAQLLAAVPPMINYQGRLTDAAGTPVPDDDYVVFFSIYDVPSGGTALWTETQFVTATDGLISVLLGSTTPLTDTVFSSTTRYLGVRIGAAPELSPRKILATVPYAHRVATVDGASGGEISGMVAITGVEEGLRLQGDTAGPENDTWVSFYDSAGTALGYVGDGSTGDQDMYLASYLGDVHIYTPVGPALTASANGSVGMGTTAPAVNSRFHCLSGSFPVAVYGEGTTAGSVALYGQANGGSAVGTFGSASGTGTVGVWGHSSSGRAGYFSGNVQVAGTLSKSAGSFKIDHPLDPANKYLSHSFVESPDMKNIYDGIVTLDSRGEALVQLPEWFGALNKDFRYQLTCVGGYAPVYVSEKIHHNSFRIAGGTPNLEVSWLVTGIRHDAYANAHRIVVEETKSEIERGFYLSPEALGHPEEKSIDWARWPKLMKELRDAQQTESGKR